MGRAGTVEAQGLSVDPSIHISQAWQHAPATLALRSRDNRGLRDSEAKKSNQLRTRDSKIIN